jgi:phosphoribosylamine---glycine ligase
MNVLIIGSGGREHALAWKLAQSSMVNSLFCVPGNGGISEVAQCVDLNVNDTDGLLSFAKQEKAGMVIVGPENPLASGIVDVFEQAGVPIFGPSMKGARIEASKIFAKELMAQNGVPTAGFKSFYSYDEALAHIRSIEPPYVIKADGLCAGKGAYVIRDRQEGEKTLKDLMVRTVYGDAGTRVIVEDFLPGIEASYLAFTDGINVLPMLPSQDHKPLLDDDKGPNTGGMGAYTPIPFISRSMEDEIDARIMKKTVSALREKNIIYKGVLYGGLMLQNSNPYVIEFNARLGDPETQPLLFKMESDLMPILLACTQGKLADIKEIKWKPGVSVCVVMASRGYPEKPEKGKIIRGLEELKNRNDVMVFHAATKKDEGRFLTSGGRVLGVTAIGKTYKEAIRNAYDAVSCIEFEGMYFRKDIGSKALKIIE